MNRLSTPFGAILRRTVDAIPGAIGGAFAANDGEMVDAVSEWETLHWATLTARFGIVLALARSAFHTFHYGDAELLTLRHDELDVIIEPVGEGYFALVAVQPPTPLAHAIAALAHASCELREEMAW